MALKKFRMAKLMLVMLVLAAGLAAVKMQAEGAVTGNRYGVPATVYSQPPDPAGDCYNSSENGMDYDEFVWDNFTLASSQAITEIHWRGAYRYGTSYPYQPVNWFTV